MKRIIVLMAFITLQLAYAQQYDISTDYKFTYLCTYQPDSTDRQNLETERFVVLYNSKNHRSLFMPEGKFNKDSLIMHNGDRMEIVRNASRFKSKIPYLVFTDRERQKTFVVGEVNNQKIYYETPVASIAWTEKDSTRLEKGLILRLAEADFGGRHWLAWYAPSYPYDVGPYKFHGLPGTIVYLYDDRNHYFFKLDKIEKRSFHYPLDLQNAATTEPEGFFKRLLLLKLRSSLVMLKRYNVTISVENGTQENVTLDDMIREAEEKARRFNNPLELD